jgi:hypothetical protein
MINKNNKYVITNTNTNTNKMSDDSSDMEREDNSDSEEEYPQKIKNIVKYIHDGLTDNEYRQSNVANNNLVKSDCCQKFFTQEGYMHQTKYGLKLQGMNTCIHCYITFNSHKFIDGQDMTQEEKDCLRYYVNTFTEDHQTMKCLRTNYGGKCVLCNTIRGVHPPLIIKDMENSEKLQIDNNGTYGDNLFDNVRIVDKSVTINNTPFVLSL